MPSEPEEGIHFSCQCSGKCCRARNSYGYVYLSLKDCRNIAKKIAYPLKKFMREYVAKRGSDYYFKQIKPQCPFLKNNQCSVYEVRPLQCRTWPFWPENMKKGDRDLIKEVRDFCPGVGRGRLYRQNEIGEILNRQRKFDSI